MEISISEARANLSEIIMHVQDPNNFCMLTRHGKPVATLVSMQNMALIFDQKMEKEGGTTRHPLYDIFFDRTKPRHRSMEISRRGKLVSKRQAALELRTLQLTRAEERRILEEGGVEPVPGGELREERPGWARDLLRKQRKFWGFAARG